MCLITEQKEPTLVMLPLTTYKIVRGEMGYTDLLLPDTKDIFVKAIHYPFIYKLGELYTIREMVVTKKFTIYYDEKAYANYRYASNPAYMDKYNFVENAFHSSLYLPTANAYYSAAVIVECLIPSGSYMYKDICGNVASDKIVITQIL